MNSQHQLSRCHIIVNNITAGLTYERLISNDTAKSSAYIAIGLVSTETSSTYSQVPFIARCKWQLIKRNDCFVSSRDTHTARKPLQNEINNINVHHSAYMRAQFQQFICFPLQPGKNSSEMEISVDAFDWTRSSWCRSENYDHETERRNTMIVHVRIHKNGIKRFYVAEHVRFGRKFQLTSIIDFEFYDFSTSTSVWFCKWHLCRCDEKEVEFFYFNSTKTKMKRTTNTFQG